MNAAIDAGEREAGPDRAADLPRDLAGPGVDAAAEDVADDEQQQHLLGDRGGELALALARPGHERFGMGGHGVRVTHASSPCQARPTCADT